MAYRQAKDRVAKEFECFIIRRNVLIFVCKGTMDQRAQKKFTVVETVPQSILEFFEIGCCCMVPYQK